MAASLTWREVFMGISTLNYRTSSSNFYKNFEPWIIYHYTFSWLLINWNDFHWFHFVDIDECAEADQGGCDFQCSNYEGGYYCSCDVGYRLMDDDKSCEGTLKTILKINNVETKPGVGAC